MWSSRDIANHLVSQPRKSQGAWLLPLSCCLVWEWEWWDPALQQGPESGLQPYSLLSDRLPGSADRSPAHQPGNSGDARSKLFCKTSHVDLSGSAPFLFPFRAQSRHAVLGSDRPWHDGPQPNARNLGSLVKRQRRSRSQSRAQPAPLVTGNSPTSSIDAAAVRARQGLYFAESTRVTAGTWSAACNFFVWRTRLSRA